MKASNKFSIFIFVLALILLVAGLKGQKTMVVTNDCEPTTYDNTPRLYTPDVGVCEVEFVGPLYSVIDTEGKWYQTLQVLVGQRYNKDLPLGFGLKLGAPHTYIMNPYLYEVIGHTEAVNRCIKAGFPCPKVLRILAQNEFPGFQFN